MKDRGPTSTCSYPALFRSLRLGSTEVPNRLFFGAHLTNFGVGNGYTERHHAYYGARAEGGAGLIVTEALTVHPLDLPYEHVPFGHTDGVIPSLRALADTVRRAGERAGQRTTLLAQLNHAGGETGGILLRQSPWAPSPMVDVVSRRVAREMTPGEMTAVMTGFAAAAERVARAGWDGVELNLGARSLLRQYLSPLTNFRNDTYGGSLENRLRYPVAVVAAVRQALGDAPILGLKLTGDELAPWGGLTPQDMADIARRLVAAGGVNYLSVTIGGPYTAHLAEAGMPVPQGHAVHLAQGIREAIDHAVPVFAEGRIESPDVAQAILSEDRADGVVVTQALISDPDLPRKAAGLEAKPIRPHIGMNRYFAVRGDWNRPLSDLINPQAGRETRLPPVRTVADPGRVLVIGGGPAGMEAAVTLAQHGHTVTLMEQGPELGGMAARLGHTVPSRREFLSLVAYYRAQLQRLAVTVHLGRAVRPDAPGLAGELASYDHVYLATGALSPSPSFPCQGGTVRSARDLLTAPETGGLPAPGDDRAVVVDQEYGFRMAGVVEWLLEQGYGVDVVTDDFMVGRELVQSSELAWFSRVAERGVSWHPRLVAQSYHQGALTCRDRFSHAERIFTPVPLLVGVQPEVPDLALREALEKIHPGVVSLGDARAPRLMGEAILDAHRSVLPG